MKSFDMLIKGPLTKFLFRILPERECQRLVCNLITWLYADLPQSRQQEMVVILQPNLLKLIRKGQIGLLLVVYHHLLRFFKPQRRISEISPEVPPRFKSI